MESPGWSAEHHPAPTKGAATRRARRALLDKVRAGQLGIATVLARADPDPVVAKTEVRRLVEAFLWHAEPARTVTVLTQAGIGAGRVAGLAGWQRAVLIRESARPARW